VRRAREHGGRPGPADGLGGRAERSGRVDHVVDEHRDPGVDVADDLHLRDDARTGPPLVDDGQARIEALRERARAFDTAGVRRHDRHLTIAEALAQILQQDRVRVDVVDRNVEEALDLAGVQIDGQDARRARDGDEIGNQLRADGHAGRDLAILPGVSVVRNHGGQALCRRALERVQHQQQLHQVVVRGRARRLDHEDVAAADVLRDLDLHLAIAETTDLGLAQRHADRLADGACKGRIGRPRE
jgi:hypothetical protein